MERVNKMFSECVMFAGLKRYRVTVISTVVGWLYDKVAHGVFVLYFYIYYTYKNKLTTRSILSEKYSILIHVKPVKPSTVFNFTHKQSTLLSRSETS